jgi:hypothetical protein
MSQHRFAHLTPASSPGAMATAVRDPGFMICPVALRPATADQTQLWQQLFERAYREAQAVVRPSILERLQTDALN